MILSGSGSALSDTYWKDQRFECSGGLVIYRGLNVKHNAPTDEDTWLIWKYSYTGGDITRIQGPLTGTWDGRDALF